MTPRPDHPIPSLPQYRLDGAHQCLRIVFHALDFPVRAGDAAAVEADGFDPVGGEEGLVDVGRYWRGG